MNIQKHYTYKTKERGVALIFALGILSLLMILAIAFAAHALLAQKEARNNMHNYSAMNLTTVATQRIMTNIRYLDQKGYQERVPYLVSRNNTEVHDNGANADTDGLDTLLAYNDYTTDTDSAIEPQWEYITNSDTTPKIIGRIAYWSLPKTDVDSTYKIPQAGNINLTEVILGNKDLTSNTAKDYKNVNNRFGRSLRELSLITDTQYLTTGTKDKLDGFIDDVSTNTFVDMMTVLDAYSGITSDERNWLYSTFSPAGNNDGEYYVASDDKKYHRFNLANTKWDSGLGATVNDESAIEQLFVNDVNFDPTVKEPSDAPTTPDTTYGSDDTYGIEVGGSAIGLPFLKKIGSSAGAYSSIEDRRYQIAANLLDYCDADDIPTSDVSASSWSSEASSNAPTYTGNEKTPYINELAFDITVGASREDTTVTNEDSSVTTTTSEITFSTNITNLELELFDIYKYDSSSPRSANFTLSFSGSVIVELSGADVPEADRGDITLDFDYSTPHTITNSNSRYITAQISSNLPTSSDKVFSFEHPDSDNLSSIEGTMTLKEVIIKHVLLKYNGNAIDFTKELEDNIVSGSEKSITLAPSTSNTTSSPLTKRFDVAFSVDDPRENLYQSFGVEDNWAYYSETHEDATTASTIRTIGKQNTNCSPNTTESTGDIDSLDDTQSLENYAISTGYIRNAPMLSPMELGAIHRGRKWQTINLKAAKAAKSDYTVNPLVTSSTGLSYSDGDGAILNHIKMGSAIYAPSKLNLNLRNTSLDSTAKALIFANLVNDVIVDGATYDVESNTGTPISSTNAKTFANNFIGSTELEKLETRAELINESSTLTLSDAFGAITTSLSTDAEKEALAGKIMHLVYAETSSAGKVVTSVSSDLKFVIVAQSIRDIGGIDDINPYGTFYNPSDELNVDEITGEVKALVTVSYDTLTGTVKKVAFELIP